MKFTKRIVVASLALVAIVSSCAEKSEVPYTELETKSLQAWVEAYNDTAKVHKFNPFGDGMYMFTVKPAAADAEQIYDGDWLYLNWVGYDMNYNVFANRYEELGLQLGTWTPRIYFTPQLVKVSKTSGNITEGQYEALLSMKVGQEVDLLLPAVKAYGASGYSVENGYRGNVSLGSSKPCRFRMVATKRVADIQAYEDNMVKEYAMANLGIKDENDTIAPALYLQVVDSIKNARPIGKDSTFKFYYQGRFIDGSNFLFDTNEKELALTTWNQAIEGTQLSYSPSSELVEAFTKVVESGKLTYGCKFKMVFSSTYGYSTTGSAGSATTTTIQPYTPLYFYVETAEHTAEEEGKE